MGRRLAGAALAAVLASCGPSRADHPVPGEARAPHHDTAQEGWTPEPAIASAAASPPPSAANEAPGRGADFIADAKVLFRAAACAGDDPLPSHLDARVVKAHCDDLIPKIEAYRRRHVVGAAPFLAGLQPAGLPSVVVYPFSGGDLVTALTTFAGATEITTVSLELTGDPRRIRAMGRDALEKSLSRLRWQLGELLLGEDYSRSETLKKTQRGDIPGELVFFLVGLAVHGMEPVSVRYFTLDRDGAIHYLTAADVDAADRTLATHRKATWTPPDFSEAFANVEIELRPRGAAPGSPVRVHRHVAANLADDALSHDPSLLRHLAQKGRVCAMTKAASYLLWSDAFSKVRGYLAENAEFMISDSTGIPPAFASRAGLVQETYGGFKSSLLRASPEHNLAFRKLWGSQPRRKLPFRYGYLDSAGSAHLLVTKRPPKP